jgi:hypothetical protein
MVLGVGWCCHAREGGVGGVKRGVGGAERGASRATGQRAWGVGRGSGRQREGAWQREQQGP